MDTGPPPMTTPGPSEWVAARLPWRGAVAVVTVAVAGYAILAAGLVALGLAVTELDDAFSWLTSADRRVAQWFAAHRTAPLDTLGSGASSLADTWTVLGASFGAGLILLAQRLWRRLVVLLVGLPVEFLAFLTVSFTVSRARPDVGVGDLPVTGSFPSGHMAVSIVLYGGIALILRSLATTPRPRQAASLLAVLLPTGVGLSRLYFGLHYVSDIVAGVALGLGSLAVAVIASGMVRR